MALPGVAVSDSAPRVVLHRSNKGPGHRMSRGGGSTLQVSYLSPPTVTRGAACARRLTALPAGACSCVAVLSPGTNEAPARALNLDAQRRRLTSLAATRRAATPKGGRASSLPPAGDGSPSPHASRPSSSLTRPRHHVTHRSQRESNPPSRPCGCNP